MKDIKFRAWNKITKDMMVITNIYFIDKGSRLEGVGNLVTKWDIEHIELMQYTGLKDKYNKEICEGDIVEFEDYVSENLFYYRDPWKRTVRGQIVFVHGRFDIMPLQNDRENDLIKSEYSFKGLFLSDYASKMSVIGNIYNHPELLESEDKS